MTCINNGGDPPWEVHGGASNGGERRGKPWGNLTKDGEGRFRGPQVGVERRWRRSGFNLGSPELGKKDEEQLVGAQTLHGEDIVEEGEGALGLGKAWPASPLAAGRVGGELGGGGGAFVLRPVEKNETEGEEERDKGPRGFCGSRETA